MWRRDAAVLYDSTRMRVDRFLFSAHYFKYRMIELMVSRISWDLMALLTAGDILSQWAQIQG